MKTKKIFCVAVAAMILGVSGTVFANEESGDEYYDETAVAEEAIYDDDANEANEANEATGETIDEAASGEEIVAEPVEEETVEESAAVAGNVDVLEAEPQQEKNREFELQLEYLDCHFARRDIKDYNVHAYIKAMQYHSIGVYCGLSVSRAIGYTRIDGPIRDSQAVGVGPSVLLRWRKDFSRKFYGSWDFAGSLLVYDKTHPAQARSYNFLWRTGPRIGYNFSANDSMSLGYMASHVSNGMTHKNPGYNALGVSFAYSHRF